MRKIDFRKILFLIPIGILLAVMAHNLSLPFFYDEAWSYFPAIKKMAELGPTLLPGNLSIDDCKGHPQFFFFISSVWMKIFSIHTIILRILPLLISIGVLLTIYFGLLKIANWETAFAASLLVSVQSMFLAQSIMLLPEMLMTLFFVMSFFYFLQKKFAAYAITSSLMVLTKETAIIFPVTIGLFYLFAHFSQSNRKNFKIIHLLTLSIPGFVYATFLLLHYLKYNVVFYGDHVDYISFDWAVIHDKIDRAYSFIFIRYGRQLISILAIGSLVYGIFKKQIKWKFLLPGILVFLSFMIFSVFNYYTQRYGLVAIVLFIILFSSVLGQLKINALIKCGITITLATICLYNTLTIKENSDVDLGYVETIRIYEDMVHFCEDQKMQDESFSVTFNMIFALRDKDLGYVKGEKEFTKIMDWKHFMEARYFVFESTVGDPPPGVAYAKENFKLIKSFTNKHAWGYIYENTHFNEAGTQKQ
jgi:4-amino-4-deoxy-L-arabinose transferase-like glycosyltransferase